jgi:aldehyde dehydrogenase (NAD+)
MSTAVEHEVSRQVSPGAAVDRLRRTFQTGRTRPLDYRRHQLDGILRFLKEREGEIEAALRDDLGRPAFEVYASEVAFCAAEARLTRRKLGSWSRPKRVATSIVGQPGSSWIYPEPKGVVLIIGPWNYPLQLVLGPLIGALAAGNCAVIKPSEVAPAVSSLVATLLPQYVDPECTAIVEGGVPQTTALLAGRFDHIFYTGNGTVGRIVMEAAAKNLTPVTLELGGKSPCIVDRSTDLDVAARRIIWGKCYNAGQTCVAPDYVLAHAAIENDLLARMKQVIHDFFGDDPRQSPDFSRIVNARHHRRIMNLIPKSGEIVTGGDANEDDRYIAPTILRDVPADAPIMADEIFGPVLPVIGVESIDRAVAFVNSRPKPLALYLFTHDAAVRKRVIAGTSSGGVAVNHVLLHTAIPALPFGGIGESGLGAYHGKATFDTFSHNKSVLMKPTWLDPPFFYPPYDAGKWKWLRRIL